jgi:periplasmic protein TonB
MPTATEVREPQVEERVRVWEAARVPRTQEVLQIPQLLGQRPLFADSLLDSGKQERTRRRYAAVLSFTFQCLLIGALLIVPLMFTAELPEQQLLTFLVSPPPPPPPPPPAAEAMAKVVRQIQSDLLTDGQLRTPSRIPEKVKMILEEEAPPPLASGGVAGGVPGGIPDGQLGGVIGGIISRTSSLAAVPKLAIPPPPKRIRVSQGVTKGLLIQKIEPKYPPLALAARIWGQVVLKAIIGKDGEIKELELLSGHPMLTPAAIEAVRQWRYRPFLLNGEPTDVETTVTVTFQISQ